MEKSRSGSGINIPDPQHCILDNFLFFSLIELFFRRKQFVPPTPSQWRSAAESQELEEKSRGWLTYCT
jgi:hypothetical protein